MTRIFGNSPGNAEIEALARMALRALPEPFAGHLADVVLVVEDFADEETLEALGIENPFELSGLYEGLPVGAKSVELSGALPDRIRLFRRAILDEWSEREDETLERLVTHIVVHEVGHHFGLSDEAMHALEEEAD